MNAQNKILPNMCAPFHLEEDFQTDKLLTQTHYESADYSDQGNFLKYEHNNDEKEDNDNQFRNLNEKEPKRMKLKLDEPEIDISSFMDRDPIKIPVKTMRRLIPKMRIESYFSESEVNGKRKIKHLWDCKPTDWPEDIPFKDPNNSAKDGKKPGKEELSKMFSFLQNRLKTGFNQDRCKMDIHLRENFQSCMSESAICHQNDMLHKIRNFKTPPLSPNPASQQAGPSVHPTAHSKAASYHTQNSAYSQHHKNLKYESDAKNDEFLDLQREMYVPEENDKSENCFNKIDEKTDVCSFVCSQSSTPKVIVEIVRRIETKKKKVPTATLR